MVYKIITLKRSYRLGENTRHFSDEINRLTENIYEEINQERE